jgi:hypothetical protein
MTLIVKPPIASTRTRKPSASPFLRASARASTAQDKNRQRGEQNRWEWVGMNFLKQVSQNTGTAT